MLGLYIFIGISVVVLLLATATVVFTYLAFDMCFTRDKNSDENIENSIRLIEKGGGNSGMIRTGREWMSSQKTEDHYITSRDGLSLHAIYIPHRDKKTDRVAVLVHGYKGAPMFDFSAVAKKYYDNGFSLLLPDQRAHGGSEGKYITFGSFERYDIIDWCKYIDEYTEKKCKFILSGVSMGATTVLLAAAEPDMIKLNYITADCGFTDPASIFNDVFKSWYHLPTFPFLNVARIFCRAKAKFDFDEFSTLDAVKKIPAPVTFIHGEADTFVAPRNSVENYNACVGVKTLITVPDAEHGMSYIKDPHKIEAELDRIFETYF